jgi:hypothetical protein
MEWCRTPLDSSLRTQDLTTTLGGSMLNDDNGGGKVRWQGSENITQRRHAARRSRHCHHLEKWRRGQGFGLLVGKLTIGGRYTGSRAEPHKWMLMNAAEQTD